ncbi:hypothetical protein NON00_19815 [Roseomonas sp. GC11]|uniref:hypothetical protein n=1 Tax=Roseomonas sp. GC11 TaxID=2950546 RepID=UPI00210E23A2|nr:hypothetical protein [Roseomonas sp. GC11]MCQ4162161.1 hypothetical protein [Roseomonas sp. GC11]
MQGCLEWQRSGLQPPATVLAATGEYFEAEDALGRWLEECCERGTNHVEATAALFASWKAWAETSGEYVGSARRLSENLINRGFELHRKGSARQMRGLRLCQPAASAGPIQF